MVLLLLFSKERSFGVVGVLGGWGWVLGFLFVCEFVLFRF